MSKLADSSSSWLRTLDEIEAALSRMLATHPEPPEPEALPAVAPSQALARAVDRLTRRQGLLDRMLVEAREIDAALAEEEASMREAAARCAALNASRRKKA